VETTAFEQLGRTARAAERRRSVGSPKRARSCSWWAGDPAPFAEAQSGERNFWRRIPTPVLVTLIGLVLSAWLLPAITRQWDDRQKAHQVKTALVTEMAEASARALTGARRLLFVPRFDGAAGLFAPPPQPLEQWSKESTRIEAELRANLTPRDVTLWQHYSTLVETLVATATGISSANSGVVGTTISARLLHGKGFPKSELVGFEKTFYAITAWSGQRSSVPVKIAKLRRALDTGTTNAGWRLLLKYTSFETTVVGMEQTIAKRVMNGHIRGYSTTWRDFVHDLIP
jgi:hypothetical protein